MFGQHPGYFKAVLNDIWTKNEINNNNNNYKAS
jgi:hypothetical protein